MNSLRFTIWRVGKNRQKTKTDLTFTTQGLAEDHLRQMTGEFLLERTQNGNQPIFYGPYYSTGYRTYPVPLELAGMETWFVAIHISTGISYLRAFQPWPTFDEAWAEGTTGVDARDFDQIGIQLIQVPRVVAEGWRNSLQHRHKFAA